jgi:dihydroorotate dehydrogenase
VIVETPVMAAAGILGFGDVYRDLIQFEKLGAFVTNPVTYQPWQPAVGTRVVRAQETTGR